MLNGDQVPDDRFRRDCHFASKLVHVCDVYDALRTTRPLAGEAWPQELHRRPSERTCSE